MPRISPLPRGRNSVNEIIPGKLYQRGQILTWQREKKYRMLEEYGIRTVVNFWPKIDSDMGEAGVNYIHIPAVQSEQMLDSRVLLAADWVSQMIDQEGPVLVLCEAGVTRSVYFCILTVSRVLGLTLPKSKSYVTGRLGRSSLKQFMLRALEERPVLV